MRLREQIILQQSQWRKAKTFGIIVKWSGTNTVRQKKLAEALEFLDTKYKELHSMVEPLEKDIK